MVNLGCGFNCMIEYYIIFPLLEKRVNGTATVVLSIAVLTGMVCCEHEQYEVCDNALENLFPV